MFKNFENYMFGVMGKYGSLEKMIREFTDKLIKLKNNTNNSEIIEIKPDKLVPGRFYLIQYNFNGNLIWCPILALDYKIHKNNHILYALNLEYLPPRYKILFFNMIFKIFHKESDNISQNEEVRIEFPMKYMNFEFIYKMLKNNGDMNWSITAYTIINSLGEIKIKKSYLCSIKIAPEIIFSDFKRFNSLSMIELQKKLSGSEYQKMGEIIEEYQKIIEEYQIDSIEYHKKVSLFREKLKLFKGS